jgi:hypothetical protein
MAWTDMGLSGRDAIVHYAVAFLDHHVKGIPEGAALQAALPGVSELRRN